MYPHYLWFIGLIFLAPAIYYLLFIRGRRHDEYIFISGLLLTGYGFAGLLAPSTATVGGYVVEDPYEYLSYLAVVLVVVGFIVMAYYVVARTIRHVL